MVVKGSHLINFNARSACLVHDVNWIQSSSVEHCCHRYVTQLCRKASPTAKSTKMKFKYGNYEEEQQKKEVASVCMCERQENLPCKTNNLCCLYSSS